MVMIRCVPLRQAALLTGERTVPSSPATLGSLLVESSRRRARSSRVRSQIGISLPGSNELAPATTLTSGGKGC